MFSLRLLAVLVPSPVKGNYRTSQLFYSKVLIEFWLQGVTSIQNNICLPTVTAATTGETITDKVTPPAIAKFRLCFEMSLPSYRL